MARNLLSFPAIAALLAFAPAASAADLAAVPVGPEPGVAVGVAEDSYAVYGGGPDYAVAEADDSLVDIDIDLGLFDDDDDAAVVYADAPPAALPPLPPEPMITK